jgi:hypothetical protein
VRTLSALQCERQSAEGDPTDSVRVREVPFTLELAVRVRRCEDASDRGRVVTGARDLSGRGMSRASHEAAIYR